MATDMHDLIWLPKLWMALCAPWAAIGLFSVYVRPPWAWRVLEAVRMDTGDDVVWTNVAYPLAALAVIPDWPAFAAIWSVGTVLMLASGAYHATYERWTQRFDVAAMMAYLSSACAAVGAVWTPWAWALVPLSAAAYSVWTWDIDSYIHVPLWAGLTIALLYVQVGAIALATVGPVGVGVAINRLVGGGQPDHWAHSAWHIGSAASVAFVLFLI